MRAPWSIRLKASVERQIYCGAEDAGAAVLAYYPDDNTTGLHEVQVGGVAGSSDDHPLHVEQNDRVNVMLTPGTLRMGATADGYLRISYRDDDGAKSGAPCRC